MAVHPSGETIGIAVLDLGSGRFGLSEVAGGEGLAAEIGRLRPAEILVSEDSTLLRELSAVRGLSRRPPWHFDAERSGTCKASRSSARRTACCSMRRAVAIWRSTRLLSGARDHSLIAAHVDRHRWARVRASGLSVALRATQTRPGSAQTGSYRPRARPRITGRPLRRYRTCCKTALNFLSFGHCRAVGRRARQTARGFGLGDHTGIRPRLAPIEPWRPRVTVCRENGRTIGMRPATGMACCYPIRRSL